MYLNKNQFKALGYALDALQMCLDQDIDQEKSTFAIDEICKMRVKGREQKTNNKLIKNAIE